MRVCVFDKESGKYFQSQVYAVVNRGYYQRDLVIVPTPQGDCLRFCDYLDKSGADLKCMIHTVISSCPESWVSQRTGGVDRVFAPYRRLLPGIRFFDYWGFHWLFEDVKTLSRLLRGEFIPVKGSIFENRIYSDLSEPGWNYIVTQSDADDLMQEVSGFHDSVIAGLSYLSGSYVDSNNAMRDDDHLRTVRVMFHSQWCRRFELEFISTTALNLRPAAENYGSNLFEAALIVRDWGIFFSDSYMQEPSTEYEGTWITAYALRWRYTED